MPTPRPEDTQDQPVATGAVSAGLPGRFGVWIGPGILGAGLLAGFWLAGEPAPSTELPVRITAEQNVSADRCVECHEDVVDSCQRTPHWNTLRRADIDSVADFHGEAEVSGTHFMIQHDRDTVWLTTDNGKLRTRIDWLFGSGHHARTPVSVLQGPDGSTEIIELAVTDYGKRGLGPSPGAAPDSQPSDALFGVHYSHPKSLDCFGCHTTELPVKEKVIHQDQILTGIRCTRCHHEAASHLQTIDSGELGMSRWSDMSALASINRCGECHRRADEFSAVELTEESQLIIRFAPVGLSQSRCFIESNGQDGEMQRLDCMTCHDPHQPASTDPAYYNQRCVACHDDMQPESTPCSVQPTTSDCLSCHMPKVPVSDWLEFTDHWIRVRE